LMRPKSMPVLTIVHWTPVFVVSLALFMAIVTPYKSFVDQTSSSSSSSLQCARLWLFIVMILCMGSIYGAGALHLVLTEVHETMATAFVLHTIVTASAAALWAIRRLQVSASSSSSWSF
jgi:hypothetical protein